MNFNFLSVILVNSNSWDVCRKRSRTVLSILILSCFSVGCNTVRQNQFKEFSALGIAYVDAADLVLVEAKKAVVHESSGTLLAVRDVLSEEDRLSALKENDERDLRFFDSFKAIQKHNRLLRDYFSALGKLAGSEVSSETGSSAKSTYDALAEISPSLKSTKIGGSTVSEFMEPAVSLIVGSMQNAALEKELKLRAELIERELALQEAAMSAVANGLKSRLDEVNAQKKTMDVDLPFILEGKLPKNWAERRFQLLNVGASSEAALAASKSSKKLRKAFQALVNNEFTREDVDLVLQDIGEVISLIELINKEE